MHESIEYAKLASDLNEKIYALDNEKACTVGDWCATCENAVVKTKRIPDRFGGFNVDRIYICGKGNCESYVNINRELYES